MKSIKNAFRRLVGLPSIEEQARAESSVPSTIVHEKALQGNRYSIRRGTTRRAVFNALRSGRALTRALPNGATQVDGWKRPARSRKSGFVLLCPTYSLISSKA